MKPVLSVLTALAVSGTYANAQSKVSVQTAPGSGVRIVAEKPFDAYRDYQPLRITVENDSGRDRRWSFEFQSKGTAEGASLSASLEVVVVDGSERNFEAVVPLAPDANRSSLTMRAVGYGVVHLGYDYQLNQPYGNVPSLPHAASVSLTTREDLKGLVPSAVGPLVPGLLPTDWRGLSSLDTVWLARGDHDGLRPRVRSALDAWVLRGGRLFLVEDDARDVSGPRGIGHVFSVRPGAPPPSPLQIAGQRRSVSYATWASKHLQPIASRSGLLTIFLLGYVLLVGPVNLFVFCPKGHRTRIFWTLPSLSLGASGFLTLLILFSDGVGGTGKRVALVHLEPATHREVLFQEQVSRTGALLARGFEVDASVAVYDAAPSLRHFGGELRRKGSRYEGDWFRSRSLQVQRLETVRPSRARLERAPSATGSIELVSSLEDTLVEIFYRDSEGRCWRGGEVTPGQRIRLELVSEDEYEKWWRVLAVPAGPRIQGVLGALYWERGVFVARAAPQGSEVPLETLGAVEWEDVALVYTGRIEGGR